MVVAVAIPLQTLPQAIFVDDRLTDIAGGFTNDIVDIARHPLASVTVKL